MTTMSQTSVVPVPALAGVRQSIWLVVAAVMVHSASQTVTPTLSTSNPVPLTTMLDPPPKLPDVGATEEISSVEVKTTVLELPRRGLLTTTS